MRGFVLAAVMCPLVGCDKPPEDARENHVAVFVDFTEIQERGLELGLDIGDDSVLGEFLDRSWSAADRIDSLLDLITPIATEQSPAQVQERRHDGGSITIHPIGDQSLLRHAAINENKIPLGIGGENRFKRKKTVGEVRGSIGKAFREFLLNPSYLGTFNPDGDVYQYQDSFIVRPLCQYLREIEVNRETVPPGHDVTHKLIILSDLLEHSSIYSFYASNRETDPDTVASKFAQECSEAKIRLSEGSEAFLIEYQLLTYPLEAGNPVEDALRYEALGIWRRFLDELGLRENANLIQ